jgi:hypothetical protein
MRIFIDIYNSWTVYEWIYLGSSLAILFLLINFGTYFLTRKWKLNLSISLTLVASAVIFILGILVTQFLSLPLSHLSLIPVLLILTLITANWVTLISYYFKHKERKGFSLIELIDEHRMDTIRHIIFLTLVILAVSIFLRGELLTVFIITYVASSLSMYLSTFLLKKFVHD